jgi:hypothetical protein
MNSSVCLFVWFVCVCVCFYVSIEPQYNLTTTSLSTCNDTSRRKPIFCDVGKTQGKRRVRVNTDRILKKTIATARFIILTVMAEEVAVYGSSSPRPEPRNEKFIILIKPNLSLMRCFRYISTCRYLPSIHKHRPFPPKPISSSYSFR